MRYIIEATETKRGVFAISAEDKEGARRIAEVLLNPLGKGPYLRVWEVESIWEDPDANYTVDRDLTPR